MGFWDQINIEIVGNFLWFCIGVLAVLVSRLLYKILPARKLWQISNPTRLLICVAASTRTHTGKYRRPSTGIGQVRALAIISASLDTAYKRIDTKSIILSDEPKRTKLENDLILLGGPKNNEVTREFLERIQAKCSVSQTEEGICWAIGRAPVNYNPVSRDETIRTDYGLIIRTKNPFSEGNKTVCLFSGGHTYGVVAAALYFTQKYRGVLKYRKISKRTLVAVVSCEVQDDCPVNIQLEAEYTSKE